ncbi:hypothetical protein [Streptomyces nojiriensis]|uniref:hypothetical protein n=1 Tax=Streptomyces nojiriensis TaxID=66374 RepID=UPI00364D4BC7
MCVCLRIGDLLRSLRARGATGPAAGQSDRARRHRPRAAHHDGPQGDYGFDVALPCPHDDDECTGYAWATAYSITCLARALAGELDDSEDIVCTVHGPNTAHDQDDVLVEST